MAHLVQQVKVVDNPPTTPHSPVSLTLTATSWGHRVLARKRPKPFPTEVPVGPQLQEEHFDWTWAAEELPVDLELAWLEWLRAAEAAWCRIPAQASSGEEQRVGHRARFPRPGHAQRHDQPQGDFAAANRITRALHRPAHGFRGKAGQTFVLVSHDGVEAQAIRRSPHNWPHRCPVAGAVAATEAAGAKVGERPRCGPLLGLPRQSVRPCRLGALNHGGGSEGAAAVGGFFVTGPGQILRARRARPSLRRRSENQFSCASYEGWRFLEADMCATFPFWAFGTGATTAAKLMLAMATRLPTYKLWSVVDDTSGHVAGTPVAATFWVNASRVLPRLTIANVKNPNILILFLKKKRKRKKKQNDKKKNKKKKKTKKKNKPKKKNRDTKKKK